MGASAQDKRMNTTTATAITKADLTERKRGKGGSVLVVKAGTWSARYGVGPFVVIDLFERKNYTKPDQIGVKPLDGGLAHGIAVADIASVRSIHAE